MSVFNEVFGGMFLEGPCRVEDERCNAALIALGKQLVDEGKLTLTLEGSTYIFTPTESATKAA